jgi:hypothetical protein
MTLNDACFGVTYVIWSLFCLLSLSLTGMLRNLLSYPYVMVLAESKWKHFLCDDDGFVVNIYIKEIWTGYHVLLLLLLFFSPKYFGFLVYITVCVCAG